MGAKLEVQVAPVKHKGHRFLPGHVKYGGRRKRDTTNVLPSAVATCIRLSLDPIAEMVKIFRTGKLVDSDGREHEVDTRTRVKLLMRLGEHTHHLPKAPVASQVEHRHNYVDMTAIMSDPAIAEAAEKLALAMLGPDEGTYSMYQNPPVE